MYVSLARGKDGGLHPVNMLVYFTDISRTRIEACGAPDGKQCGNISKYMEVSFLIYLLQLYGVIYCQNKIMIFIYGNICYLQVDSSYA